MDAIIIKDVEKKFKVYYDKGQSLKERFIFKNRSHYEDRLVLKGVSFTIKQGEAIGLIGENGCGKSTLLKLMTKILYPNNGLVQMNGRISSLIELGAGFHPDMSGRENIYTNASIFGLNRKEINNRINEIIEFSELGKRIDNPVRTYSSGMYMRLAFSVAINVDADILLIDEILAVGDASFQAKCFSKLQEIRQKGTTIVIVSHDTAAIAKLCYRAVWINDGLVQMDGSTNEVLNTYIDYIMNKNTKDMNWQEENQPIKTGDDVIDENGNNEDYVIDERHKVLGNHYIEMMNITMSDIKTDIKKNVYKTGDNIKIKIDYVRHNREINESVIGFGIFKDDGTNCYGTNTFVDTKEIVKIEDMGTIELILEDINLLKGHYIMDIAFHHEFGQPYHYIFGALEFDIYSDLDEVGIARIKHIWKK